MVCFRGGYGVQGTFDVLPWVNLSRERGWIIIFMYGFNGGVCLLLFGCYADVMLELRC